MHTQTWAAICDWSYSTRWWCWFTTGDALRTLLAEQPAAEADEDDAVADVMAGRELPASDGERVRRSRMRPWPITTKLTARGMRHAGERERETRD